ncbi:hypothetical protein ACWGR4_14400 [Embleya sp. NPDC055664]|uniref:hypothetical protein n=1 Tax=Embleya sp. NPDC059237 TaxID=3346784 RepID=UPI0036CE65C5
MTARQTDRRHPISTPLVTCALCAVAGAVLCLAAVHRSGLPANPNLIGLLRQPAPLVTLVFGLSGLLVALRGRTGRGNPVESTPPKAAPWSLHHSAVSTSGPPRHGEGATHSPGAG